MKTLNELAIETCNKLMSLSDAEFFSYFDKLKPSELSEILLETDLVKNHNARAQENSEG